MSSKKKEQKKQQQRLLAIGAAVETLQGIERKGAVAGALKCQSLCSCD